MLIPFQPCSPSSMLFRYRNAVKCASPDQGRGGKGVTTDTGGPAASFNRDHVEIDVAWALKPGTVLETYHLHE